MLLDLRLPGEDGLQIARQLRETSRLPIIILTGVNEEADRVMGLELGADDYLTKPFSPRDLLARIRALLRRSQMQQSVAATHTPLSQPVLHANAAAPLSLTSTRGSVGDSRLADKTSCTLPQPVPDSARPVTSAEQRPTQPDGRVLC